MNKLEEIINMVALKKLQQNMPISSIYVNNKTYNLIKDMCQTTNIDYDDLKIKACNSVDLIIDDTLKDGEIEYK